MIKQATRYDIPRLIEMIEQYALENPNIELFKDPELHDASHIEQFLFSIIMGRGFILMDKNMRGCFIALRTIWCPKITELHQLMWWVEPEFRGTLSGKLWKAFDKAAIRLLDEKKIDVIYTSITPKSTFTDFTKRGYSAIEAKFYRSR
jgi:N-acetylglutamate synthase-like GNAT family acetyltransferase